MNILVVGSAGTLGIELCSILSEHHQVYALQKSNKNFWQSENVHIINMDLLNVNFNNLPSDTNVVYYLAQSSKFRNFPNDITDVFEINVFTMIKFLNWSLANKIEQFIYTSSGAVYPNESVLLSEKIQIETDHISDFYSTSKYTAELVLKNFKDYFKSIVILRPFFIYGIHQKKEMLIPRLIKSIKNGERINLTSKHGLRINPIYANDAAIVSSKVLNQVGFNTFNVAGKEIKSLFEICQLIGEKVDKEPIFTITDRKTIDMIADTSLMEEKLYSPKIDLSLGLDLLINHRNEF